MSGLVTYRRTYVACYSAYIVQAIIVNLPPLLFVPLMSIFGFSYEQMGRLVLINFSTQFITDLVFSTPLDKFGFRPFTVAAHVLTCVGLLLFAVAPVLTPAPYALFVLATVVFSIGGGLLELIISPIVNAIPTDGKASAMSLLHSFYSWGQVAVALLTTAALALFGRGSWPWIIAVWTVIPLVNIFSFAGAPLPKLPPEAHKTKLRELLAQPFFLVAVAGIMFAGASELNMSQWASAFMEKALNLPKAVGDIAGMCLFALMMGIGRTGYGFIGNRIRQDRVMLIGAATAFVCYLVVAFTGNPVLSLAACALTGLAVSLLWPGTLSLAAGRFPMAGASMFAVLAAGGDLGASVGPWLVGFVADNVAFSNILSSLPEPGLRVGLLVSALFPIGMAVCLLVLHRMKRKT